MHHDSHMFPLVSFSVAADYNPLVLVDQVPYVVPMLCAVWFEFLVPL